MTVLGLEPRFFSRKDYFGEFLLNRFKQGCAKARESESASRSDVIRFSCACSLTVRILASLLMQSTILLLALDENEPLQAMVAESPPIHRGRKSIGLCNLSVNQTM